MSWVTKSGSFEYYGEKVKYWGKDGEMWYKFETPWAASIAALEFERRLREAFAPPSESISQWGMF